MCYCIVLRWRFRGLSGRRARCITLWARLNARRRGGVRAGVVMVKVRWVATGVVLRGIWVKLSLNRVGGCCRRVQKRMSTV